MRLHPRQNANRLTSKANRYQCFLADIGAAGLPPPVVEHRFALPDRKWQFDFAWPELLLAVEVDGGAWIGGRHSRGVGMMKDNEKLNTAAIMGYRVMRFFPSQVKSGEATRWLIEWMKHNQKAGR